VTIAAQGTRYALRVTKKRLDVLMVERGLAETRSQAQALVLAGKVPGHAKAGEQVEETAEIEVEAGPRFVSRGGEKLANALAAFHVDVEGEDCLDVGASTGGFTDCLLQDGAARVCALAPPVAARDAPAASWTIAHRRDGLLESAFPIVPSAL